jgi:glycosyltransferase involved in cell wall biosynthesis
VIIPMRNEERHIERCLNSLLRSDYPADRLEFLIADGRSTDRSGQIVAACAAKDPRIRLLENPGGIVPTGLNKAIQAAHGEVIVRADAHTDFAPNYVRRCVELLSSADAASVGGVQRAVGSNYISWTIAHATMSRFAAGDAKFRYAEKPAWVETVYLGAWRKQTLMELGGFNERWVVNQDYELNHRLRKAGGRILLDPELRCEYRVRSTLRALARQYFRYGFWKVNTIRAYPDSLRWRQLAAPALVAGIVVSLASSPWFGAWAVVPPGAYLASNVMASFCCARSRGWRFLPMLPLVFAMVHFAWGMGFWAGALRFGLPMLSWADWVAAFRPVAAGLPSAPRKGNG